MLSPSMVSHTFSASRMPPVAGPGNATYCSGGGGGHRHGTGGGGGKNPDTRPEAEERRQGKRTGYLDLSSRQTQ